MNRFIVALLIVGCVLFTSCNGASTAKPNCGGSTSSKSIQLISPANPPRECIYRIKAYSKNVCQLRIEFAMTLAQPSLPAADNDIPYSKCVNDVFQVGDVQLCGTETKQHINVPFDRAGGVSQIDVSISMAARGGGAHGLPTPTWDMKITQLECTSKSDAVYIAPAGCLQYFPEASGVVTSFNYDLGKGVYPGMMNYAICFRRQTSTDNLDLKAAVFDLGGYRSASLEAQLDNYCYSEQDGARQSEDYLIIPQGIIKNKNVRANLFCGHSIDGETVLSTNPGPQMLVFNSGAHQNQSHVGFYISYKHV